MSLGAVLGIAGSVLSSRSQRKAQSQQNQYNEESYLRQVEAEKERDYLNQYGVYSRLQRPFEEAMLTQMQRRMRLGGFTPETRQVGQDLLNLQREYDKIETLNPQGEKETDEAYSTRLNAAQDLMQTRIDEKLKEKSDIEYAALSETSAQFDPMRQYEQAAGMGIYDGSMLENRLASMKEGQDLRSQLGETRQQYLPGIEAAQNVLYDPSRTDEIRKLNLKRAEDLDNERTRALRLLAARDRSVTDPLQQGRLDLAEANVAGIRDAALAQAQAAGMGRTYGGSSTVLNKTQAALAMQGNQQAAVQRAAAIQQNLMEDQGLLKKDYAMQAANLLDVMQQQRRVNDAGMQNAQQLEAARVQRDRNALDQIQNRQGLDLQSLNEQQMTAAEIDAAKLAAQRMQLSNIGISDRLYGSAIDAKTAVERQLQALDQQRERSMAVSHTGQGGMLPIDVPAPRASVKDYWGSGLSAAGNYLMGQQGQQTSFENRMKLMKQQGLNQQGMYAPRPQQQQMFGGAGNNLGYTGLGGMGWGGGGGMGGGSPMWETGGGRSRTPLGDPKPGTDWKYHGKNTGGLPGFEYKVAF